MPAAWGGFHPSDHAHSHHRYCRNDAASDACCRSLGVATPRSFTSLTSPSPLLPHILQVARSQNDLNQKRIKILELAVMQLRGGSKLAGADGAAGSAAPPSLAKLLPPPVAAPTRAAGKLRPSEVVIRQYMQQLGYTRFPDSKDCTLDLLELGKATASSTSSSSAAQQAPPAAAASAAPATAAPPAPAAAIFIGAPGVTPSGFVSTTKAAAASHAPGAAAGSSGSATAATPAATAEPATAGSTAQSRFSRKPMLPGRSAAAPPLLPASPPPVPLEASAATNSSLLSSPPVHLVPPPAFPGLRDPTPATEGEGPAAGNIIDATTAVTAVETPAPAPAPLPEAQQQVQLPSVADAQQSTTTSADQPKMAQVSESTAKPVVVEAPRPAVVPPPAPPAARAGLHSGGDGSSSAGAMEGAAWAPFHILRGHAGPVRKVTWLGDAGTSSPSAGTAAAALGAAKGVSEGIAVVLPLLASASDDGTLRVWAVPSGAAAYTPSPAAAPAPAGEAGGASKRRRSLDGLGLAVGVGPAEPGSESAASASVSQPPLVTAPPGRRVRRGSGSGGEASSVAAAAAAPETAAAGGEASDAAAPAAMASPPPGGSGSPAFAATASKDPNVSSKASSGVWGAVALPPPVAAAAASSKKLELEPLRTLRGHTGPVLAVKEVSWAPPAPPRRMTVPTAPASTRAAKPVAGGLAATPASLSRFVAACGKAAGWSASTKDALLAASSSSALLASCGVDGTLRLWLKPQDTMLLAEGAPLPPVHEWVPGPYDLPAAACLPLYTAQLPGSSSVGAAVWTMTQLPGGHKLGSLAGAGVTCDPALAEVDSGSCAVLALGSSDGSVTLVAVGVLHPTSLTPTHLVLGKVALPRPAAVAALALMPGFDASDAASGPVAPALAVGASDGSVWLLRLGAVDAPFQALLSSPPKELAGSGVGVTKLAAVEDRSSPSYDLPPTVLLTVAYGAAGPAAAAGTPQDVPLPLRGALRVVAVQRGPPGDAQAAAAVTSTVVAETTVPHADHPVTGLSLWTGVVGGVSGSGGPTTTLLATCASDSDVRVWTVAGGEGGAASSTSASLRCVWRGRAGAGARFSEACTDTALLQGAAGVGATADPLLAVASADGVVRVYLPVFSGGVGGGAGAVPSGGAGSRPLDADGVLAALGGGSSTREGLLGGAGGPRGGPGRAALLAARASGGAVVRGK